MKMLTFSRLLLGLGLVVGFMVFLAAESPIAEGADLILGGYWVPISEGTCCTDIGFDHCPYGLYPNWHPLRGNLMSCEGYGLWICEVGFGDGLVCQTNSPSPVCSGPTPLCYVHHAKCEYW